MQHDRGERIKHGRECATMRRVMINQSDPQPPRIVIAFAVAALTLIAAGLRLWRLDTIPAGLHFDEAAHGLLVESTILRGQFPVFFSAYTGHEALYHYTLAPFLALLGPTMWAIRLPAALWSVALVPVTYLIGSRLWDWRVGLFAALATACGSWLQHVGRIGFRANTLPVVVGLAMLFLYLALQRNRRRDWITSGALFGLGLYTYLAVRVLPLLAPLLLLYLLGLHRPVLRRSGRGIALFALALVIVAMPFAYHMLRVPSDFFERFNQIAVTQTSASTPTQTIGQQAIATFGMFGVRGAQNDFFNLPGRPVFPGVAVLPFYLGGAVAVWRWRELRSALIVLWLIVLLLPTILAADAPHWLRAIGAAPPTCVLWGVGAAQIIRLIERLIDRTRARRALPALGVAATVLVAGWWTQATARAYFNVWASRPELYYAYMQYATDAARTAQATPADRSLLIAEDYYRHATYLFQAPRTRTAQWFDARSAAVWPRSTPWSAIISASTSTDTLPTDLAPLLSVAQGETYAPNGLYAYIRLDGTAIPPFDPPTPFVAQFGDVLALQGFGQIGSIAPDQTLRVELYNRAIGSPGRDLRFFVHIEDERNTVIAQQDALGYDAREWQAGDQFISIHRLTLPSELPAGPLRLVVGLYDVTTGERFVVTGDGAQGDFIELPLR